MAAVVAILAIILLWAVPRLQPATGTLVVVAAGRAATSLTDGTLMLQRNDGSWITVGSVSGSVPPAPDQHQLIALPFPVGTYDHIRLRGDVERVNVTVAAGQVRAPSTPATTRSTWVWASSQASLSPCPASTSSIRQIEPSIPPPLQARTWSSRHSTPRATKHVRCTPPSSSSWQSECPPP